MQLKLYNTMSRKKETFSPLNKKEVQMYSCGPTVYSVQHIGNMRAMVVWDVLKRVLMYNDYKVKQILNVTDVGHLTSDADEGEDKMMKALKLENLKPSKESMIKIARKYEKIWKEDMAMLNVIEADVYPRATEHVAEMIEMISGLSKNGFVYETDGVVYFDISKDKNYGKLAKLKLDDLKSGARVKVDTSKKNPQDFALWFKGIGKHDTHLMQWDSPFGKGFPGWHIECSAMSTKYLGDQFDIHTGGIEHISVHHVNEISQTEGATGKKPWVKYWMHNEHLLVDNHKMSKSEGTAYNLADVRERGYDPLALRFLCLTAHYRKPLNFTFESMDSSLNALEKLRNRVLDLLDEDKKGTKIADECKSDFMSALNDDMNTPRALAVVWDLLKDDEVSSKEKYETLINFDRVLGLDLDKVKKLEVPQDVTELAALREHARNKRDWAEADRIRDEIKKLGFIVKDSKEGSEIRVL